MPAAVVVGLRASGDAFAFTVLGGMVVALLATAPYVLATSTGETARRDADDP